MGLQLTVQGYFFCLADFLFVNIYMLEFGKMLMF